MSRSVDTPQEAVAAKPEKREKSRLISLSRAGLIAIGLGLIMVPSTTRAQSAPSAPTTQVDPYPLLPLLEPTPANMPAGADPFPEAYSSQPYLYFCAEIPAQHKDEYGVPLQLPSVVFQSSVMVASGLKARTKRGIEDGKRIACIDELLEQTYGQFVTDDQPTPLQRSYATRRRQMIDAQQTFGTVSSAIASSWESLAEEMVPLVAEFKMLVNKEGEIGHRHNRCAQPVSPIDTSVGLGWLLHHAPEVQGTFAGLPGVPERCQPLGYTCYSKYSKTALNATAIEQIGYLKLKIGEHLQAAMQRDEMYRNVAVSAKNNADSPQGPRLAMIASDLEDNLALITSWNGLLTKVAALEVGVIEASDNQTEVAEFNNFCMP